MFAIESVPIAFGIVTTVVASPIAIMALAIGVVNGVTWLHVTAFIAVVTVEKAFRVVTFFIAYLVLEQFPARHGGGAVDPWANTQ